MIKFTVPYPVSANRYWRSFVNPTNGRSIVTVSKEAKKYKNDVAWLAKKAGIRQPLTGRIKIHIQLYPNLPADAAQRFKKNPNTWDDTVECIDLDNARKVLFDALTGIAYLDDKAIWKDSAERMRPIGQAHAVIWIAQITGEEVQKDLLSSADPAVLIWQAVQSRLKHYPLPALG